MKIVNEYGQTIMHHYKSNRKEN